MTHSVRPPHGQPAPPPPPAGRGSAGVHRNPWETEKSVSVFLAVLFHGISSMSPSAIPPSIATVLTTASKIEEHLTRRTTP